MKKFILLSEKPWHNKLFDQLSVRSGENWIRISKKESLTFDNVDKYKPDKIFIPHWSYILPVEIWSNYDCVVFHMTDLPFGRGGSPLQNLILRGYKGTKISAFKVNEGIDAGDVYLKHDLDLSGTANEIFIRSVPTIKKMISSIIDFGLEPSPQVGEVVNFVRRKPEESDISMLTTLGEIYNHIRMLDCDDYPKAFLDTEEIKYEFTNCVMVSDKLLEANVRIIKK